MSNFLITLDSLLKKACSNLASALRYFDKDFIGVYGWLASILEK